MFAPGLVKNFAKCLVSLLLCCWFTFVATNNAAASAALGFGLLALVGAIFYIGIEIVKAIEQKLW